MVMMILSYYMILVEIKGFTALIDSKPFIDQPVKNKQGEYEKLIEMSNNNDYTTRRLLDYLYHQKFYKRIGTDSWRETNTNIPRQMNFVGTSEED